jgi:hypothetical protein
MQVISFTTEKTGWRQPRVGALLDEAWLLDFKSAAEGEAQLQNFLAWLDVDTPWFRN